MTFFKFVAIKRWSIWGMKICISTNDDQPVLALSMDEALTPQSKADRDACLVVLSEALAMLARTQEVAAEPGPPAFHGEAVSVPKLRIVTSH